MVIFIWNQILIIYQNVRETAKHLVGRVLVGLEDLVENAALHPVEAVAIATEKYRTEIRIRTLIIDFVQRVKESNLSI